MPKEQTVGGLDPRGSGTRADRGCLCLPRMEVFSSTWSPPPAHFWADSGETCSLK